MQRLHIEISQISDIMTPTVLAVTPELSASQAERLAALEGVHRLVVVDEGRLVGIVCTSDLAESHGLVGECMHTTLCCIDPDASVIEAAEVMEENAIGCLPVISGETLVGIVTRGDLRRVGVPATRVRAKCASCGSMDHVRCDERWGNVPFCRECVELACPPEIWEELGMGD